VGQTSTRVTGFRVRVFGILVGACLLLTAAVLAVLPVTADVAGSTAHCGFAAFALRAPSESDDKGFNAVDDACSGAAVGRLFTAFLFGGTGVIVVVGSQRWGRRRAASSNE
jgi:hypothetical protein